MNNTALIPVCGIGASAGGIEALQQFFGSLPTDLGLAYVVIVHLAPDRKSELPHILTRATAMPVTQVADHDQATLLPDHVYVIGPDRKLEITDSAVNASPFEQRRGPRNAVDLFFRSLAEARGDGFAIVLSGTGSDGVLGAKAIKERGGFILVQDPHDAAHGDMPRAVINSGIADVVGPARDLASQLAELSRQKRRILPAVQAVDPSEPIPEDEERALRGVLELLRKRTGHDFSKYKRNTVLRRLARRMQLARQVTIQDYLNHLRTYAGEVQGLLNDLLISVTMFFRDPDAWRALQTQVIGRLVEDEHEQIRVWVPGCATGEEAYSLAMLFHEEFDRRNLRRNLVIFASDVDEAAITVARDGLYPRAISADVSEERLGRFFRVEDDHYRVQSEIRDHVVFAVHSLLRDPPFSRLHLISCRNLLIYLDHDLQEHVMAIFRYACRDDGDVFLGASETASDDLFETTDAKHRIFHVRDDPAHERPELPAILASATAARFRVEREPALLARPTAAETHLAVLEDVAPPSILVDDRWNVLHLSPTASRFLQQSGGPLARRLTDLVRAELRDDLHSVLHRAVDRPEPQLSPFVPVAFNGTSHRVALLAVQRRAGGEPGVRVLVTFLDGGAVASEPSVTDREPSDETVRELREKLRQAERRIETMRDDHFLTNEDLRAANEELQSLNEEYRSTTEELETSKEELQSINEELQTVNNELKLKLEDVSRTHGDLENFIAASNVAMLFLDRELRIKRFTPKLAEIFHIKTRDYDRPIGDLTHTLEYSTFQADAQQLLGDPSRPIEREIRNAAGQSFLVRLSAYRQANGHDVDGIVVTFVDITEIKRVELALRDSEAHLGSELEIMRHLHRVTVEVAKVPTLHDALQFLLSSAVDLHGADFGNVQLVDPASRTWRMVVHHGFAPAFIKQFQSVTEHDETECGRALRTRQACQISDVEVDRATSTIGPPPRRLDTGPLKRRRFSD